MAFLRKEKRYWRVWRQPVLTANGTMGGDSFAVSSNVVQYGSSDCAVYMAFDDKANTQFHSTGAVSNGYIDWYNPQPLIITNINLTNQKGNNNRASTSGKVYGSDNGVDWVELTSYTNSTQAGDASWNISLSSNKIGYKYYRLTGNTGGYWTIAEIVLTAKVYDEHWGYKAYNTMRRFIKHTQGDYNPQNVLVIGSPTITGQGVASGFSTANYIRPTAFKPESSPWEMVWKITTGNDVDTVQTIFGVEDETNTRAGVWIRVQGRVFDLLAQTASSGDWTVIGYGTYTVLPNTTYYIRASWDGSVYTLDYSLNGSDWINQVSVANSTPIYRVGVQNEDAIGVKLRSDVPMNPFLGSIDLSESYMKVDGQYYWTGFYTSDVEGYKAYNIINHSKEIITQQFDYTGALQTFTVPNDVTSIQVDCVGATGAKPTGKYFGNKYAAGKGGRVKTEMSVTPGETLFIWVGKEPSDIKVAEYNASDIRTSSADITSEEGLNSRLVVAGAGGNGAENNWTGWDAGQGGGLIGGSTVDSYGLATGGTQTAGGTCTNYGGYGSQAGGNGTFGMGGAGSQYASAVGGAGGAGWYGGAGGNAFLASNITGVSDSRGGAGGSSYTDPTLCSNVSHVQGFNDGNGYVKISYKRRRF